MKCFNMFFVCLAAISIMLLGSCSSDSSTNPPANTTDYGFTCTLNGGGYTNQAIKITPGSGSVYSVADDQTAVTCTNAATEVGVVSFKGNKTGTYKIEAGDDKNLVMMTIGAVGTGVYIEIISGTINVTSYGAVGGDVIGTFSGQGEIASNGNAVQITNGTFKAKRAL